MPESDKPGSSLRIVVVDDDARVGATIGAFLRKMDCAVKVYTDSVVCLAEFEREPADIVITDLQMPVQDGMAVLQRVKALSPATDVIIVTGAADKKSAIAALKFGAFDFFEKPVDAAELVATIQHTVHYRELVRDRDRLAEQVAYLTGREAARWGLAGFVGRHKSVKQCLKQVRLLQGAPRTAALITGESGTGKELVARAVHVGSARCNRPFVALNCSAVPAELAESTLFGHLRGAFTGAATDKRGSFDLADGGTLFLDEIGDMPLAMQAKLLRVLEDGIVTPVGGTKGHPVDVRVVSATNASLEEKIAAKAFRADLYFRLARFHIQLPPLRDRKEDIPLLAEHFLQGFAGEMGKPVPRLSAAAASELGAHSFPGNVRELKNIMERALIECTGTEIRPEHLHCVTLAALAPSAPAGARVVAPDLPLNLQQAEVVLIRRAMQDAAGNMAAAARLLGINRSRLYRKLAAMPGTDAPD